MLFLCHDFKTLQGHFAANSDQSGLGVESVLCVRLRHLAIFVPVTRMPHNNRIEGCSMGFGHASDSSVQ